LNRPEGGAARGDSSSRPILDVPVLVDMRGGPDLVWSRTTMRQRQRQRADPVSGVTNGARDRPWIVGNAGARA